VPLARKQLVAIAIDHALSVEVTLEAAPRSP
jgi:hypothetical protein